MNTVGRMRVTGRPDQFSMCSASQCSRCWWDSVVLVRTIWETVICYILASSSTGPPASAAAATVAVASTYSGDTLIPK